MMIIIIAEHFCARLFIFKNKKARQNSLFRLYYFDNASFTFSINRSLSTAIDSICIFLSPT